MTSITSELTADPQSAPFDAVMDIASRPPLIFASGQGSWLTDTKGRTYLDFIQGWAVNCFGYDCSLSGHAPRGSPVAQADPEFNLHRLLQ
jgi:adenosylmethionine-8-amino-7-oxononanoate aminotransferase